MNAAKTELMAVCQQGEPLQSVQLSDDEARHLPSFNCLGDIVDPSASWEAEINARISNTKRISVKCSVCGRPADPVALKMQCVRAYVLPAHVLLFGSETWALTQKQADLCWK